MFDLNGINSSDLFLRELVSNLVLHHHRLAKDLVLALEVLRVHHLVRLRRINRSHHLLRLLLHYWLVKHSWVLIRSVLESRDRGLVLVVDGLERSSIHLSLGIPQSLLLNEFLSVSMLLLLRLLNAAAHNEEEEKEES
jgi:hypothetical protein